MGEVLASRLRAFGTNPYAAGVMTAVFSHSTEENQVLLARALLHAEEGLLSRMARTRKGSLVVKAALNMLEATDREAACKDLTANLPTVQSRYGRSVCRTIGEKGVLARQPTVSAMQLVDSNDENEECVCDEV